MSWNVRTAVSGDRDGILGVVRAAHAGPGHDSQEEVDIVVRTWDLAAVPPGLELVAATADQRVLGHVMAAVGDLAGRPALGIAPLSVAPVRQRQGIGSALMREVLDRAEAGGWSMALLLGDPAYYTRFGFEPAVALGIAYAPVGAADPHFLVRRLRGAGTGGDVGDVGGEVGEVGGVEGVGGEYSYCWE